MLITLTPIRIPGTLKYQPTVPSEVLDILSLQLFSEYSFTLIPEPHRELRTVADNQTVLFHIVALVQELCQIPLPFRPERAVQ